jgi:hypothetical protein
VGGILTLGGESERRVNYIMRSSIDPCQILFGSANQEAANGRGDVARTEKEKSTYGVLVGKLERRRRLGRPKRRWMLNGS